MIMCFLGSLMVKKIDQMRTLNSGHLSVTLLQMKHRNCDCCLLESQLEEFGYQSVGHGELLEV